ncbi:nuclear transport factor 2 family protein [Caenimonas aquaedulcis]|uniref:Nuclear transport factor 2 family protein n=1 Tax=Caenimonas aquaedulcis TaxID=2793270 RepID=A0A931MJ89_9BURK|nr:nuclear transport factor 2 family protein [Caenimonas aquaedulcis]MBG9390649.1 nuclear transport factor 2 family protein [Caenimonas aquaedulcis]
MASTEQELIKLEERFWQSLVAQDADTATQLLAEPALMVSAHGAMKFDHAAYRKMATQGTQVVTAYEFSDMEVVLAGPDTAILTYGVKQTMSPRGKNQKNVQEMHDSSTWVRKDGRWQCVMHTETPVQKQAATA